MNQERFEEAVRAYWDVRVKQQQRQQDAGKTDAGLRGAVTGGAQMDALVELMEETFVDAGFSAETIYRATSVELPGYYRPEKKWDLVVIHEGQLAAAIEFKSQVGPSFGNNFNNRTEEAIGTAHDLWTAYREEAFGKQPRPFVGWLMMVEDSPKSRCPVRDASPHFPVFEDFKGASYLKRYDLLCQKLVQEQLYTTASIITAPRKAVKTGDFSELSPMTGLKTFVTALAGHVAAEAARLD